MIQNLHLRRQFRLLPNQLYLTVHVKLAHTGGVRALKVKECAIFALQLVVQWLSVYQMDKQFPEGSPRAGDDGNPGCLVIFSPSLPG